MAANSKAIEFINEDIKESQGTLTWIWRGVFGVIIINIAWYLIQRFVLKSDNQKLTTQDSAKEHDASGKSEDLTGLLEKEMDPKAFLSSDIFE